MCVLSGWLPSEATTGTHGTMRGAPGIEQTRLKDPNVLVLHAGDAFQGDPFFTAYQGVADLEMMAAIGFDAMAVGNHELDLGPEGLRSAAASAFPYGAFPLLSANLDTSGFTALDDYVHPWVLRDVGGLRVGIFGMTDPGDPLSHAVPAFVLGADNLVPVACQAVDELRAAGADVVVCLSHLGTDVDETLAASVAGIDVVVGGRSEAALAEPIVVQNVRGGRTLLLNAGRFYEKIGRLRLRFRDGALSVVDYHLLDLDKDVPEQRAIALVLSVWKQGVTQQLGDMYCAQTAIALKPFDDRVDSRTQPRDSPAGNLVTDAFRARGNTDIALLPSAFVAQGLPEGWLNGADLFRVVSHGYESWSGLGSGIATFRVTGNDLLWTLEATLAFSDDYMLQVSGMRHAFDGSRPIGSRLVRSSPLVAGAPLDSYRDYSVTASTSVAELLPLVGVPIRDVVPLGVSEYDALRDYVFAQGIIVPVVDGRVRDTSRARSCEAGLLGYLGKCRWPGKTEKPPIMALPVPGKAGFTGVVRW